MNADLRPQHQKQLQELEAGLAGNTKRLKVKKKTISNLFRYEGRKQADVRLVDLSEFNKPLYLDIKNKTLEVQGLTTYENIVDFVLPHNLLPTITPELKNITVGGVTVGIGIESNCYRYGFVHDGLLEADVLLPGGKVITCSPTQYSDLFYGLPNSYGTLGYILRAKIKLHPVKPYVVLETQEFSSTKALVAATQEATKDPAIDYVESLMYSKDNMYLTCSKHTNNGQGASSIYGGKQFYKEISGPGKLVLPTKDYIFRYDPEWFWNIPESPIFKLFRKVSPEGMRSSGFYSKYNAWKSKLTKRTMNDVKDESLEMLIQDWEVPWDYATELLDFALAKVDLEWRPWLITVIKTPAKATCYPMQKDTLYLNLGSYSFAKRQRGNVSYANTKLMDEFCFKHGGIKMLYSSTFLTEKEFYQIYAGTKYTALKHIYDPKNLLPTVFEKTVKSH